MPRSAGSSGTAGCRPGCQHIVKCRFRFDESGCAMATQLKTNLAGLELPELEQARMDLGHPRFHGRQVFQWIHKRGVADFALMSDLSRDLRTALAEHFEIETPALVHREQSADGTTKLLLGLADGKRIETVCIPE